MKYLIMAALLALGAAQQAHAGRAAVPLVDSERVVANNIGVKSPGVEAMRAAILRGGARHQWMMRDDQPGKLRLVFNKQNKHEVTVDVLYDAGGFQVRYVTSLGMQYASLGEGAAEIHPFYNRWVANLNSAISSELLSIP